MLVVDLLHDLRAAAHVGVIFQGQTAVSRFQFIEGANVGKVFHGCSPFVCDILNRVCIFLRDIQSLKKFSMASSKTLACDTHLALHLALNAVTVSRGSSA